MDAFLKSRRNAIVSRYGLAIAITVLATTLRLLVQPHLGDQVPFIMYFPAICVIALLCGLGPTLLAVALSVVAAAHFFMHPADSLLPDDAPGWISLALFTLTGIGIALLGESWRRKTEQALQEGERFSVTLTSIGDGVIVTDQYARVTFINPVAERLTGCSIAEAQGKPLEKVFRIVNEQTRETDENPVAKALREGRVVGLANHTVLITRDGTELAIDDSAAPIREPDGTIVGVVLVFRDVSQQKAAERRRNARLAVTQILAHEKSIKRVVAEILPAVCSALQWDAGCFWRLDADENVLRCQEFWQHPSRQMDEFRAASLEMAFEPGSSLPGRVWESRSSVWIPDVAVDMQFVRAAQAKEAGLHGGFACPVAVGDEFLGVIEFFSHEIQQPDDDLLEMMATIGSQIGQFIENRQAEQKLRRSEQELSDFFENAALGLHWVGPDGIVLRVNQAELDMLGYTQDEFVGHHIAEFHADQPVIENMLKCLTAGESLHDYEARLRCKDGSIRHVLIDSNVLRENGEFIHSRCFTRDITHRKQAEAALRESEERLRLAHEAGRMGTWEWHIPTGRVIWSPTLEAIHGLAPGSFPGTFEAYQQDIHPDDRQHVLDTIRRTVDEGREHHLEYRVIWPDGGLHWLEARGQLFRDETGLPIRLVGVCSDITERKRLEQQLQQQLHELADAEARIRSVVDNVIDGIITIDHRGLVTSFNPAAERIFGYAAAEVIGENVRMLMPEPYHSEHDRYVASYLRTGEAKIIGIGREVTGRRKDGSMFPLDLAVSEFQIDHSRFFTGLVRDITERKRIEQSLKFLAEAGKSLSSLVDYKSTLQNVAHLAVPDFADWCAVDMVDAAGQLQRLAVAHVDPTKVQLAEELYHRYPSAPDAPRGMTAVFRTGEPELVTDISDEMLVEGAQDEAHLRILRELELKSYICVPLRTNEKTLGVLSFVSTRSGRQFGPDDLEMAEDLAHRAAIAVENARLYQELRDADRRKDEFLAMLAHELRNPLAPIRAGLDILAMDTVAHPETVSLMQQQVEHVVRLVDDLLDVSRIMRGRIELRKESVELAALVKRSVEAIRPLIQERRQTIDIAVSDEPIWLYVDPVRLLQVLENLLNNASKYTDAGGRIELAAERLDHQAVIRVRDWGIGIEPELLPKIFDLFTQSSRALDRAQGGLGIGLTLVKRLVEMHEGVVSAASEGLGYGSTIVVQLPLGPGPVPVEVSTEQPRRDRRRRVLVVDDNVGAARMLSLLLEKLNHQQIDTAYDGPSALKAIQTNHPEIVFLDIGLPGMDGYRVAQEVRQNREFDDVLLVALTGYGHPEDRQKSKNAGFDEHLVKPPSVEQLQAMLDHPKLTK